MKILTSTHPTSNDLVKKTALTVKEKHDLVQCQTIVIDSVWNSEYICIKRL